MKNSGVAWHDEQDNCVRAIGVVVINQGTIQIHNMIILSEEHLKSPWNLEAVSRFWLRALDDILCIVILLLVICTCVYVCVSLCVVLFCRFIILLLFGRQISVYQPTSTFSSGILFFLLMLLSIVISCLTTSRAEDSNSSFVRWLLSCKHTINRFQSLSETLCNHSNLSVFSPLFILKLSPRASCPTPVTAWLSLKSNSSSDLFTSSALPNDFMPCPPNP